MTIIRLYEQDREVTAEDSRHTWRQCRTADDVRRAADSDAPGIWFWPTIEDGRANDPLRGKFRDTPENMGRALASYPGEVVWDVEGSDSHSFNVRVIDNFNRHLSCAAEASGGIKPTWSVSTFGTMLVGSSGRKKGGLFARTIEECGLPIRVQAYLTAGDPDPKRQLGGVYGARWMLGLPALVSRHYGRPCGVDIGLHRLGRGDVRRVAWILELASVLAAEATGATHCGIWSSAWPSDNWRGRSVHDHVAHALQLMRSGGDLQEVWDSCDRLIKQNP